VTGDAVRIVEMGPRDGLQNEPVPVTKSMPVQVSVPTGPVQLRLKPMVSTAVVVAAST